MQGTEDQVLEKTPDSEAREGEHIAPDVTSTESADSSTKIYADIAASFTEYTERPDLLLETIEKHDPGFIQKMNQSAVQHSEKLKVSRFNFGERQAYISLAVSVIAALGCIGALFFLISKDSAGFMPFIGLAVFYAISQGGPSGFLKIIEGCKSLFEKESSAKKDDG